MFDLATLGAVILAGLTALGGFFFWGKKKGKDKVKEEVAVRDANRDRAAAEEYKKAVEKRQHIENEVGAMTDEEAREELKNWVDFKPGRDK